MYKLVRKEWSNKEITYYTRRYFLSFLYLETFLGYHDQYLESYQHQVDDLNKKVIKVEVL